MSDFNERIASLTPEKRALFEKHFLQKLSSSTKKQEIPRRATSGPCVLSFNQERLWIYNQLEPGTPNIISCVFRMSGSLDHAILKKTLDTIVARHESLRTTFSSESGMPMQIINPARSVEMSIWDLGELPGAERDDKVRRVINSETNLLFDLSTDLMLRPSLIRLSDTEHFFILIMHHIASDGWSMEIFFHEMLTLYRAFSEGKPSPLPGLPIQYADFACWQRKWMEGEVIEKQLSYWKEQLADMPEVLELPSDRTRPAVRSLRGASHSVILPGTLVDNLKHLSVQEGVTMFTLMMAAFKIFLYRYTGQGDLSVGTFVANRTRVEIEKLIGFFVNTLVLRIDLGDNPTLPEFLQREHEVAIGAFDHQDMPFEKILEVLGVKRDMRFTPLFQVALAFQDVPAVSFKIPDLNIELLDSDTSVSLYDLSLIIEYLSSGIKLSFTYRTDIFEASTIERWAHNFKTLLESIAADPEAHIETLPLLTEAEKKQIVVEWNNTSVYYPGDLCIHEMIEAQVEKTPDAISVIHEGRELSYRELNNRANQLAHYLRKLGVGTEVLVGICVDRSLEMLVGILGILKAGGAYVPMDPAYPHERLKLIMSDAGLSVLLTRRRLSEEFPLQDTRVVYLDSDWELIACESKENPAHYASPDNAAYVIYTSGTTGKPRGVVIQHGSLVNFTCAAISQYGIEPSDRILQFSSISFDASAEEIFPCLTLGATLILRTDEMLTQSNFLQKCEEWKLTVLSLPTAYWHILTLSLEMESLKIPASIRLLIIGGEKALPERLIQWQRHAGAQVRIINTYGPTEATVVATLFDLTHFNDDPEKNVPIGLPMPNVRTHIMDSHLHPVPIGVCGELYIGGPGLARGYLNVPDLTAEKFISNPFSKKKGERLYRTGDIARYLPDGNIEFLGRIDHQVKVRGFRIELGEIESSLGRHPAIRETAVIAREEQYDNKRLVAYVVFNQNAAILTSELRSFLKETIPDYMMPSAFVVLDSLPLTPSGKLDRRALPEPDSDRTGTKGSYVSPRTPIEEVLTGIWCEILGLNQVGVHDNFFELGGHSLLATQVISRLRKVFDVEIPLRTMFESPTVEGLASALLQREGMREKLEKKAALLLKVAGLSEDEVNTMLAEQLRQRDNKTDE